MSSLSLPGPGCKSRHDSELRWAYCEKRLEIRRNMRARPHVAVYSAVHCKQTVRPNRIPNSAGVATCFQEFFARYRSRWQYPSVKLFLLVNLIRTGMCSRSIVLRENRGYRGCSTDKRINVENDAVRVYKSPVVLAAINI